MRAWGKALGAGREGCPGPSGHSNQGDGQSSASDRSSTPCRARHHSDHRPYIQAPRALFPIDLLPRALVPREVGAAATAARLSALILPSFRWITVLAGITGPRVSSN